ncbi:MAG: glycosyltransferase [Patescibacteria group bacterium]
MMKVALVYDRVNKWGGAERVLLALHELYPDAPLYTAVYDKKNAPWATVFDVRPSFLNNLPFASSIHELLPMVTPFAFETFSFDEFDLVISVTSAEAKNIITKPNTHHICYCLTPTRFLWSGYDQYREKPGLGVFSSIGRIGLTKLAPILRRWDRIAASRPDVYIAISERVKKRIQTYYDRQVEAVIYPPVEIHKLLDPKSVSKFSECSYFLTVSRLVSYKKIDLLIEAFNELKLPLTIIGKGREENFLKKIAGNTITFVTRHLTEKELVSYYDNCRAFLYCADEDFGIVAVEAQARGKAVIAYKESGVAESVIDGKTGILFTTQSIESIDTAIHAFEKSIIREEDCKNQALLFSKEQFKIGMRNIVEKFMKGRKDV